MRTALIKRVKIGVSEAQVETQQPRMSFEEPQNAVFNDSIHLSGILEEDIWNLIFSSKLGEADKQNLINSSKYFRDLLWDKRVLILSKPVFQVLFPTLGQVNMGNVSESLLKCNKNGELKPFILSTRLICNTWKTNVDKMALKWRGHSSELKVDNLVDYLISLNYTFSSTRKTERFLSKFDRTHSIPHANPFIGRSISMSLVPRTERPEEHLEFFPEISTLLNTYGEHIQKCDISILNTLSRGQASNFVNWLWAMPNLKRFNFLCDRYSKFTNIIRDLPHWKDLNEVVLQSVPHEFIKQLMQKNAHIINLSITGFLYGQEEANCLNELQHLKNLQVLVVDVVYPSKFDWIKNLTPSLNRLEIFNKIGNERYMRWSEVFSNLSKEYLNKLEYITVELPKASGLCEQAEIMKDSLQSRLVLPNLKKLQVEMKNLASLDFILGVKDSLEELIIKRNTCKEEYLSDKITIIRNTKIIQFVCYEDNLLNSNIWHLIPKLNTVCVNEFHNKTVYKRNEHLKMVSGRK